MNALGKTAFALLFLALALAQPGCRSGGLVSRLTSGFSNITKIDNGKVYAVTAEQTAFYRYGPQQGNGPDRALERDTLMTLIRPSFGYCKVQLKDSGEQGYVAAEDIKPASPTLLAALNTPPPTLAAGPERENFDVQSSDANFVPPPESLPAPDLPPSTISPTP